MEEAHQHPQRKTVCVLLFHRHHPLAPGVHRACHVAGHSEFRAYVVATQGLTRNSEHDGKLSVTPPSDRFEVTIPLEGRFQRVSAGTEIGPGEVIAGPVTARPERWIGESFRALVLEWKATDCTLTQQVGTLSALDVARLRQASEVLTRTRNQEVAQIVVHNIASLVASTGIPVQPQRFQELDAVSESDQRLLDALAATLSPLPGKPAMVDLTEMATMSERQIRRRLPQVTKRVTNPAGRSFRALTRWLRLTTATSLLEQGTFRVKDVARLVGYSTTRALHHAMADAGMPRPSEIRKAG